MYIFYWRWYINSQSWYINTCILSKWQLYYYVRITYMFADMYTDWKGAYTYIHILGHLYDSFIGSHGSYSATPLRTTKLLRSLSHINIYIDIIVYHRISFVYPLHVFFGSSNALPKQEIEWGKNKMSVPPKRWNATKSARRNIWIHVSIMNSWINL